MTDRPENPQDDPARSPSDPPPLAETIRAKLEEYEVERHLEELASTIEGAVRQGVSKVGELAHEHKDDLGRWSDKAADAVDRRTDGKHADRISQVRGSLERGVDKIADQRHGDTPEAPDGPVTPPSDVPPSNG
jgi:RNA-splicing ligase RtcB